MSGGFSGSRNQGLKFRVMVCLGSPVGGGGGGGDCVRSGEGN